MTSASCDPAQLSPPSAGSGTVQVRFLILVANGLRHALSVPVQSYIGPHSDQPPFTEIKKKGPKLN